MNCTFETKKIYRVPIEEVYKYVDGSKGTSGKGEYYCTYLIKRLGNSTEVTLRGEIMGLTGISKLISKLLITSYRKICMKELDGLRNYLESKSDCTVRNQNQEL